MRCSQQIDSLDARLKQMEVNMFQNLFLMTMNSSQVSVQLQNQANSVRSIQLQRMATIVSILLKLSLSSVPVDIVLPEA